MLEKLKELINKAAESGLKFPFAYDPVQKQPSVTLLFVYITFIMAATSSIALNFTESTLTASLVAICFWALAFIFYRLRRLDKVKIDLDDRSIELENKEPSEEEDKKG